MFEHLQEGTRNHAQRLAHRQRPKLIGVGKQLDMRHPLLNNGAKQVVFVFKIMIDQPRRTDSGSLGDIFVGGLVQPFAGKDAQRAVDNLLAALLVVLLITRRHRCFFRLRCGL
jgi:hypothetical protein